MEVHPDHRKKVIHDKVTFAEEITRKHTLCSKCFSGFKLPPGWGSDKIQMEEEEEDSDPSEAWASDSSQSELDDN